MVLVYIDGHEVNIEKGATILQACNSIGIEIPRFCYHERLSIAGNCRMCLVEVEKSAKPVASCAMPVMEGMKIFTNSNLVKKAREGVLEFLLVNHPLDCPICDQGGECDLQDQAMIFGSDRGRFYEFKRSVNDKNLGPLVKTIMTRCIHCTRCIRFASEVAGVEDLGTTGRGKDTEVGTYIEKEFDSELSGNIIDLCPVGALTSKPYAFTARPWELKSTESIDILDAMGSNIRIDVRGSEIMRILPRLNEDINEEWISDKSRFSYDGLKCQRLYRPMLRKNNKLMPISWLEAFLEIEKHISSSLSNSAAFVGPLVDSESLIVLKDLFNSFGSNNVISTSNLSSLQGDLRFNYISNTNFVNLENSDLCLLLGTDLRVEAPLLNTRLRKNVIVRKLEIYTIGSSLDLTYNHIHLGNSLETVKEIAEGKHYFCQILKKAKKPSIIIGQNYLEHHNYKALLSLLQEIGNHTALVSNQWNGFNVIHNYASSVAALDLGYMSYGNYLNKSKNILDFTYLIGVDDEAIVKNIRNQSKFIVYQGHHGDIGALYADLILPGSAYTEKNSIFVNMEGRPQKTKMAFYPPGESREDWKILRALGEFIKINLHYTTLEEIHKRFNRVAPHMTKINEIQPTDYNIKQKNREILKIKKLNLLTQKIDNFYMTDSITKSSQIMAKCSKKSYSNFIKLSKN